MDLIRCIGEPKEKNITQLTIYKKMTDTEKEIAQLEKEIENRAKRIQALKKVAKRDGIKPLADYSVEEKIRFFDKTYQLAEDHLADVEKGQAGEDDEHWFFEHSIAILNLDNSRKLWDYYNSVNK
jgi:vacuolar-type H+-ATPase subunit I/STV1